MDYCEDFRLVQSTLIHCNEFVKKFEKIMFYGGNEVYVEEISLRLKNVFLSKSYSTDCNELRKVTFLLMLNTNVSFSRDLNEDSSICHLLNNFPQLSPCLLVHLVQQLKLQKYFNEAIRYSPPWFMLQFISDAIDSIRFSKPLEALTQVRELIESIYYNICRMDYKVINMDNKVEQKIVINKLLDFIMSLLRNFNTPNADDEISKSKKRLKEYLGRSLDIQLSLIRNCFTMFQCKPQFEISEELKIYKLMIEKETEFNNNSKKNYSVAVQECLEKVNLVLLNVLQNSVLNITLDDFVFWVEIDLDDPLTEDIDLKRGNLQKSIGEQSYELIQFINENSAFEHNVVNQLTTISIKPKSVAEIAREATVGTVLDRIESSPNRRVWLDELLNRPDTLFFNTECLQTIIDYNHMLEVGDLLRILKDHQDYGCMDREDEVQMKEIFRLGGERLNNFEKRDFIEELIRVLGVDYHLLRDDEEATFSSDLTNYSNKLTEKTLDEDKMWKLILISPNRFYEKLLANVSNQDKTQIEIIFKILAETSSVTEYYLKRIVMNNLSLYVQSSKSHNYIFLVGLFKLNLIDRKEFVRELLMENLAQAISSDNISLLSMLLNTLRQISASLKVEELITPLTIILAQILDKYRWDLMTFNQDNEFIVESSIEIIQDLVKTILTQGNQKDKDWIIAKIKDFKSLTKYYFQKLSLKKSDPIATFDKFLHPLGFDGMPNSQITSILCETIVRCTSKEFKWLMSSEILQKYLSDALFVVTIIVSKSSNQQGPLNCLHKCVSDYVKTLKDLIIPTLEGQDKMRELFKKILELIKNFPSSSFDELSILFIDSLKYFKNCENFETDIIELQDCELKRILLTE